MLKWNDDQLTNQSICNSYILKGLLHGEKALPKKWIQSRKILFEFWDSISYNIFETVLNWYLMMTTTFDFALHSVNEPLKN